MMKAITRLELLAIRDALLSTLEEEDIDEEGVQEALEIVEALLNGEEVTLCQEQ